MNKQEIIEEFLAYLHKSNISFVEAKLTYVNCGVSTFDNYRRIHWDGIESEKVKNNFLNNVEPKSLGNLSGTWTYR